MQKGLSPYANRSPNARESSKTNNRPIRPTRRLQINRPMQNVRICVKRVPTRETAQTLTPKEQIGRFQTGLVSFLPLSLVGLERFLSDKRSPAANPEILETGTLFAF
jgi:hypothetical protein